MAAWDDPDVGLLYEVNGLARDAPTWAGRAIDYAGVYGTLIGLALLGLCAWWRVVRRKETREEAVTGFAALLWTPLAAGIAVLVNVPIRGFVERPRPFLEHRGVDVLVQDQHSYSFVSGLSTLAMALAIGIFMVHRRYGLLGIAFAALAGLSRVYLGVHYPTDVIGGLALGAAVALLLAPPAMWLLTPVACAAANSSRVGRTVWDGDAPGEGAYADPGTADGPGAQARRRRRSQRTSGDDRDLAA